MGLKDDPIFLRFERLEVQERNLSQILERFEVTVRLTIGD